MSLPSAPTKAVPVPNRTRLNALSEMPIVVPTWLKMAVISGGWPLSSASGVASSSILRTAAPMTLAHAP